MKVILQLLCFTCLVIQAHAQNLDGSAEDRQSLDKATAAIRDAFSKGDAALAASLHHPNIVKYFGKNNVVTGRVELERGLAEWFKNTKVEFVENKIESTVFTGQTAIQTCIFAIKSTPKQGGQSTIGRGRSMVIYVRDKSSPTGWLSLREMTQEAPDEGN
jgi:ketosteroid isomerase-like protein